MGIEYGKKEIQKLLETDMFYRKDCLNYSGFLKGEKGVTYQEFIASWLISKSDIDKIFTKENGMQKFKRKHNTIKRNDKDNVKDTVFNNSSNRHEEKIAMRIIQQNNSFGKNVIMYYQVPINRQDRSYHGKVDLVGFNNKEMLLIELKDNDSKENLLRAIVEIYTYYLKIKQNLEKDLEDENDKLSPDFYDYIKENNIKIENIVPCVMFFRSYDNKAMQDFDEMKEKKNNLYNLSKKLGIRFYSVRDMTNEGDAQLKPDYKNTNYEIREEKY